jgi:hypothetical protein
MTNILSLCLISECLKVGSGIACSTESHKSSGLMMEVVIIISEIESTCPCFRECSSKTEVRIIFFSVHFTDLFINQVCQTYSGKIGLQERGISFMKRDWQH